MSFPVPDDEQLAAMSTTDRRVYENRLRRMASRQRLTLTKSSRRDPLAYDYGEWRVTRYSLVIAKGNVQAIHEFLLNGGGQ